MNPHANSFPNKLVGWNFSTGHSYGLDLGCLLVTSAVKPQSEGAPAAQPPSLISRWQRWQNFYLSWHNWTTRRHRDSIVTWCSHTIQAVEMALPLRVFQCYSTIPHRHLLIRSHSHPPKEPGCAPQPLHPFPIGLNLAYLGLGLQLSPGPLDGTVSLQISKSTKLQAWSSRFDPSLLSPVPHILHNLRESQQSSLHPIVLSKTLSSFFFQSPAIGLERGLRTCCFPRGPGFWGARWLRTTCSQFHGSDSLVWPLRVPTHMWLTVLKTHKCTNIQNDNNPTVDKGCSLVDDMLV